MSTISLTIIVQTRAGQHNVISEVVERSAFSARVYEKMEELRMADRANPDSREHVHNVTIIGGVHHPVVRVPGTHIGANELQHLYGDVYRAPVCPVCEMAPCRKDAGCRS